MTYGDIYTKFLIEYDKENITSSYPSLTPYEIATILDKAYLALIAQKVTGNNPRRAAFEADTKAIEDLRPLVKTYENFIHADYIDGEIVTLKDIDNIIPFDLSDIDDFLYYVSATVQSNLYKSGCEPVTLISHESAQKFIHSSTNKPWIKTPMAYLEGTDLNVIVDPFCYLTNRETETETAISRYGNLKIRYIKHPLSFVADGVHHADNESALEKDKVRFNETAFELNDSMAEELIHLALVMALETTQSPQINTTIQTRALES